MKFDAEDRALLETVATKLYEEALESGGLDANDERFVGEGEVARAFEVLQELGLLVQDHKAGPWVAGDPMVAHARVAAPLERQGAELMKESSRWAQSLGSLAQSWRRTPGRGTELIVELRAEQIQPYLDTLVADAEKELITAQPQVGRAMTNLPSVLESELALLGRGVRLRTLYQHTARRSADTRHYVREVTKAGAEVRTVDEFFNRLIVIDRRVAVIPGSDGPAVAKAVYDSSIVAYLVDMFERAWDRARQFGDRTQLINQDIAGDQRAMTIRMLIEGRSDQNSAKRVGVSPRTYAGYIAQLKAENDADTRFQLGYSMGQKGITGSEDPAEFESQST